MHVIFVDGMKKEIVANRVGFTDYPNEGEYVVFKGTTYRTVLTYWDLDDGNIYVFITKMTDDVYNMPEFERKPL